MCLRAIGRSTSSDASDAATNTIHCVARPAPTTATIPASAAAIATGPRKKPSVAISPTASTPAAIIHQTQSSTAAILIERPLDVREQVRGVLAAGGQADEALGHGVAAPARAALGDGVDAAEAGGVGDELGGGEEALGALLAAEVERDDHAVAVHLPPRDLVTR